MEWVACALTVLLVADMLLSVGMVQRVLSWRWRLIHRSRIRSYVLLSRSGLDPVEPVDCFPHFISVCVQFHCFFFFPQILWWNKFENRKPGSKVLVLLLPSLFSMRGRSGYGTGKAAVDRFPTRYCWLVEGAVSSSSKVTLQGQILCASKLAGCSAGSTRSSRYSWSPLNCF